MLSVWKQFTVTYWEICTISDQYSHCSGGGQCWCCWGAFLSCLEKFSLSHIVKENNKLPIACRMLCRASFSDATLALRRPTEIQCSKYNFMWATMQIHKQQKCLRLWLGSQCSAACFLLLQIVALLYKPGTTEAFYQLWKRSIFPQHLFHKYKVT